jgi:ATP-dependent helicase/nuclease subunit B
MKDNAIEIIFHIIEELSQSDFVPVDFEMKVGEDIPAYELEIDSDTKLILTGSIDRVDLMEKNGNAYIRVIDYKTGNKDFKLSDILYGINLQMLIYLYAIQKNSGNKFGGKVIPSGVLYQPSTNKYINANADDDSGKILAEQNKNLKMKGLVLDNPTVISAMDKMGLATYIPVSYSNGKLKSSESTASLEEMGRLFKKIDKLLIEMAKELHMGNVEFNPVKSTNRYDACAWCPYLSVCGYEAGKNCRNIDVFSKKEVFEQLEKEEENAQVD